MDIIFNKLYRIDVLNNEASPRPDYNTLNNFKLYIQNLLTIIGEKVPERQYKFRSDATEVNNQISEIINNEEYISTSNNIAKRLLWAEIDAQEDLKRKNLPREILKGMLIIALVKMNEDKRKLIISKVDYDEFLSELTGEINSGLSMKKKVYKAFVCEIDNDNSIINTLIFDTSSPVSVYWWDKFLELEVCLKDGENTTRAFDIIEKDILNPLKKDFKTDYFHLWNSTIRYFRAKEEFSIEDFIENAIGEYLPYNNKLNIVELKEKIKTLPNKYPKKIFDSRFLIVKDKIRKHLKNTIKLTEQIDLLIKEDIPNPMGTISVFKLDNGDKYISIKSNEGYEYFERNLKTINNE